MADFRNLRSISAVTKANPEFSEPSLRWKVFKAKHGKSNFGKVLVFIDGRVFIDIDRFNEYLEERRGG